MSDSPPPTSSAADDLLAALHALPPAELQDLLLALLPSLPPEHLQAVTHKARHLLLRDFVALLPPEVALAILARLRVPDLVHAAHVSHAWHALASDHGLWRDLYHRHGWTAHAPPLPPLDAVFQPRRTQDPLLADPPVPRSVASVPGTRPWIPPPASVAYEDGCPAEADLDCWPYLFQQRHRLLRNMRHGTPSLTVFEGHREGIYCIQADPFKLISGSRDNTVRVWNLRSNATTHVLEGHAGSVLCLEYNATHLVTGSSDRSIRVWSVPSTHDDPGGPSWEGPDDTYQTSTILHGHAEAVLNLRMDPKHHRIVSCSKDSTIRVWDWHRGACIRALEGHVAAVNAVQMRHDTVVSVSGDRTVRVWDLRDHHRGAVHQLVGHVRGVACVAFDGTTIASGSSDATIRLWDLRKAGGAPVPAHAVPTNGLPVGYQSTVPGAAVAPLAPPPIAPDGSAAAAAAAAVAAAAADGHAPTAPSTAPVSSACVRVVHGHSDLVRTVQFSADDDVLCSGSYDTTVRLWSLRTGQQVRVIPMGARVLNVQYVPGTVYAACQNAAHVPSLVAWQFAHGVDLRGMGPLPPAVARDPVPFPEPVNEDEDAGDDADPEHPGLGEE